MTYTSLALVALVSASTMTRLTVRTAAVILKGLAYLLGGLLFGALPLLVVAAWKVARVVAIAAWKVTLWMVGAVLTGAVLIARSV